VPYQREALCPLSHRPPYSLTLPPNSIPNPHPPSYFAIWTTPTVTGFSGAPAPLYQDDPTIPKGTTKQVDFAASGATTAFQRVVKDKNGKVMIEEKFVSKYSPWRAVFLVGTG
jgi:hypothetical protein